MHQEQENRKKIYRFFDYNPYDYRLYLDKILNTNQYEHFCVNLKSHIDKFYQGYDLQALLKAVPHYPVYRTSDLKDADCLLISHEPGLKKETIEKLYKKLTGETILQNKLNCTNYTGMIELLNDLMDESMVSWLAMNPHIYTGEINGDTHWAADNLKTPWKELGKLGYFFEKNECQNVKKSLHFDLFPYPKENTDFVKEKQNVKRHITCWSVSNLQAISNNKFYTANFLIYLFNAIKAFLDSNKSKYICIIAHYRAKISSNNISYNAGEHAWIVYKVVEYIKQTLNSPVEIRFINQWPSKNKDKHKHFKIYQYSSLDINNKRIMLKKIKEYYI